MSSISPIGVEELKRRILSKPVYPPDDLTLNELTGWISGYAKCQEENLKIIESMFENMRG